MTNRPLTKASLDPTALQGPEAFLSPALFETLFWKPRFLPHVPVIAHLPLLFWLVSVLRPRRAAVLGCNDGSAHFAICQALDRLGGDRQCLGYGFWPSKSGASRSGVPERLRIHQDMLYEGLSELVLASTADAAFDRIAAQRPELLVVDLDALPPEGRPSGETLMACLSHPGILVLHGANCGSSSGEADTHETTRYLARFLEAWPHVRYPAERGLVLIACGEDIPLPLCSLLDAADRGELRGDLERIFRRSGQNLLAAAAAAAEVQARARVEKTAAQAQAELQQLKTEINALRASHEVCSARLAETQVETFELRSQLATQADALAQFEAARAAARAEVAEAIKARVAFEAAQQQDLAEAEQRLEAMRGEAQDLRVQLAAAEEARVLLEAAQERALAEAALSKTLLQDTLKSEQAIRFSETAALTQMAEDLRGQLTKLMSSNAELAANLDAANIQEKNLKIEISNERRVRFKETATLTRMIEDLKVEKERKKRPFEAWLVEKLVNSERKRKKYNLNRAAFFLDSQSMVARAYFRCRSGS